MTEDQKEAKREYQHKYCEDHKEEKKEYDRKYYEKHKEEMREYRRKYYQKNKEKILEKVRQNYEKHHAPVTKKAERDRRDGEIFFARVSGESVKDIVERYGLSQGRISTILNSQGVSKKKEIALRNKRIFDLFESGKTRREIAEEMGKTYNIIWKVLSARDCGRNPQKINCGICDEVFLQKASNHLYCSDECRAEAQRRHTKCKDDKFITKICEYCEKKYRAKGSNGRRQRFCNKSCAQKYKWRKNEVRNKEIFYLREHQYLTFKRIGEIFDISVGAALRHYRKKKREYALKKDSP